MPAYCLIAIIKLDDICTGLKNYTKDQFGGDIPGGNSG